MKGIWGGRRVCTYGISPVIDVIALETLRRCKQCLSYEMNGRVERMRRVFAYCS